MPLSRAEKSAGQQARRNRPRNAAPSPSGGKRGCRAEEAHFWKTALIVLAVFLAVNLVVTALSATSYSATSQPQVVEQVEAVQDDPAE